MNDMSKATYEHFPSLTSSHIQDTLGVQIQRLECEEPIIKFNELYPLNVINMEAQTMDVGTGSELVVMVRVSVPGASKLGVSSLRMGKASSTTMTDLYEQALLNALKQYGIVSIDKPVVESNPSTQPAAPDCTPGVAGTPVTNKGPQQYSVPHQPTPAPATPQPVAQQPTAPVFKSVSPNPSAYDGSQWTQEQRDFIANYKSQNNIPNDEIMMTYVRMWDPNTQVQYFVHMTCEQMDAFLNWIVNGTLKL